MNEFYCYECGGRLYRFADAEHIKRICAACGSEDCRDIIARLTRQVETLTAQAEAMERTLDDAAMHSSPLMDNLPYYYELAVRALAALDTGKVENEQAES